MAFRTRARQLLSDLTDSSSGYSPLTLRFDCPDTEAAFLRRRQGALVRRLTLLCGIYASVTLSSFAFDAAGGSFVRSTFPTEIAYQGARVTSVGCIVGVVINALCVAALHTKCLIGKVQPSTLEVMATLLVILDLVFAIMGPSYIVKIMGHSLQEAYGEDKYVSDSGTLLRIDAVITALHVGCPLRWFSLFPVEVAGVLVYVLLVFAVGSNEPMENNFYSISLLVALVLISALGKRAVEIGERQAYMDIIKEKSLRFEAEHQLELVHVSGNQNPRAQDDESQRRSQSESVPTTTLSDKIFDACHHEGAAVSEQLAGIVELGQGEHWSLKAGEVKIVPEDVLGVGSYGCVVKGVFCGAIVAVKLPHDKLKASDLRKLPALCNELRIMRQLRHPNIVAMHGAVVVPELCRVAIVMDFIRGRVLKDVVQGVGAAEPDTLVRYQLMFGVCNALLYLHSRNPRIVHGDLKHINVIVEAAGDRLTPKLLDFGLARVITRRAQRLGGTLPWMAPELLQKNTPAKCSADVYSFGRMIVFIATGVEPMPNMCESRIIRALVRGRPLMPQWPQGCAFQPSCEGLVRACLRVEEGERPRMAEISSSLVALPQELGLVSTHGHILDDVLFVAAHRGSGSTTSCHREAPAQGEGAAQHTERTSAQGEQQELRCREALPGDVQPGSPAPAERHATLHPFPAQPETSQPAIELTLARLIARWNVKKMPAACCQRHADLTFVRDFCSLALTWSCVTQQLPAHSTQCKNCGVLGISGDRCDVCDISQSGEEDGGSGVESSAKIAL